MSQLDPPVIIQTSTDPTACVIWLHGLGADGHDFEAIVPELNLPDSLGIRFIFPHAPKRPVSINGGVVMRAWYDISAAPGGFTDDDAEILQSVELVRDMIANELDHGMLANRIVLAGFSQGGAIALAAGLSTGKPLAGIMALSTYLPLAESAAQWLRPENVSVPIFQAHGLRDPQIPVARGKASRDFLQGHGYSVSWHEYPMEHSVCVEEIADLSRWLVTTLGSDAV